ncbi:MAG: M56 family metallopeptidase [Vicinamibacterales bacterium]
MSQTLLLLVILLGSYAAISTIIGVLVGFAARTLIGQGRRLSANGWLSLRLAPVVVAAAFTLGGVWPAFAAFEPRDVEERPGAVLIALAVAAIAMLAMSAIRLTRAMRAHRQFTRRWLGDAVVLPVSGLDLPIHLVGLATPLAALVGATRPQLVMSARVVDACSTSELRAIGAHEAAHLTARDNLKRLLLHLCPDALRWTGSHRRLVEAWSTTSEEEADDRACAADEAKRLVLASLLIKVARLGSASPVQPASSPLIGSANLERRVRRLLDPPALPIAPLRPWRAACGASLAAAFVVAQPATLALIHQVVEQLVGLGR